ncbi:MAG: hypothetical protein KJP14_00035 [Eudoraea sp.]|nr:hypothetical protein [Eudoraea sp.]
MLVVIGILVALQINNWNEERKQRETQKSIINIIKEDLKNDITEINEFIINYEEVRKPNFEALLYRNPTKEEWKNNPQYVRVFAGYTDISINHRGFDLFKNQTYVPDNDKQNLFSEIIIFYNKHINEIEVAQQEMSLEFQDNSYHFKKFDWMTDYFLHNDMSGFIDYVTNDPDARNRMLSYSLFYRVYVEELKDFKKNAQGLIYKIDTELKDY